MLFALFAATCVLFSGLAGARLLRRAPAAARHVLLLAAVLCFAAMPALLSLARPADVARSDSLGVAPTFNGPHKFPDLTDPAYALATVVRARPTVPFWVFLWIGGTAVLVSLRLARLAGFLLWLRCASPGNDTLETLLATAKAELGVDRNVSVRTHPRARVPLLWGLVRPIVVIPQELLPPRAGSMRWMLLHELAHLRRRDPHWQLVVELVCAVYWFHPLIWFARRELLVEQEIACDEIVVSRRVRPSDYSGLLVTLARRVATAAPPVSLSPVVPSFLTQPTLQRRIRSILDPALGRRRTGALSNLPAALPLVLAVLVLAAVARASAPGSPQEAGRIDTPEALEHFLDPLIAEQMEQQGIVGATFAMVRDGGLFFAKGYGHLDVERSKPVDPADTIFRVGSISKVFTAVAALQLVDRGKLALDEDVNHYLREFKVDDRFPEPVRLRHLLTHTAGFDQLGTDRHAASREEELPLAEFLAENLVRIRPPGDVTCYDTYGVTLAGYLVEVASGLPYPDYLRRNLFEPLGMTHSGIYLRDGQRGDVAVGYDSDPPVAQRWEFMNTNPASTINSTAEDMAAFLIMLLDDGEYRGRRILSAESARAMRTLQFTNHPALPGYTFLLFEDRDFGVEALSHGGSMTGYAALIYLLPANRTGIFLALNRENGAFARNVMARLMPRLIDDGLVDPEIERVSGVRVESFTGAYADNAYNHTRPEQGGWSRRPFLLEAGADGVLWVGGQPCPFVEPLLCRTTDGLPVAFREGTDGRISEMFVRQNTYERLDEEATLALAGPRSTSAQLEPYVGSYRIDRAGLSVRLFARDGYLISQEPDDPPRRLKHVGEDRFENSALHLHFDVEQGRAAGFTVEVEGRTEVAHRVP